MARIKTYGLDTNIDPADKVIGSDGTLGNNFGKTKNFSVAALSGFIGAGSQGPQGPAGETGATGPAGQDGVDGVDGVDGAQGPAGNDGADGATGPTGQTGPQGATGQTGAQGAPGADGTSISVLGTVANCLGLPTSGNTSGDLYVLDADDAGCSYGAGTAGDGYVWTSGNTWLNIGPLRGPQGIQGIQGAQGAQGAPGVNGSNGEQGIQGIQGIQGQAGQNGSNGAKGETGAIGPTGPTGPQGPQGIQGPPGAVESVNAGTGISVTPNTTGNVTVSLTSDIATQTQITLSQDDIFSLNNQGSVELLPAPGVGKIIVVEACAYHSPEPTVGTGFSISGVVPPKFGIKVEGAPSHFCSIPDFIASGFGNHYQYDVAQDVQFNNTGPNSPLILKGGPDLVITNPNPPTAFEVKIIIFYRILEFV